MALSHLFGFFPAKASRSNAGWMPLWMHSLDTAEIFARLLDDWLPAHVKSVDAMPEQELEKVCRFLALTHDIGKMTPVFAARILEQLPELRSMLETLGLQTESSAAFHDRKESPHARAGEAILINMGCPAGLAAIVGAHHGKPQDNVRECAAGLEVYFKNYYGSDTSRATWQTLRQEFFSWALEQAGFSSVAELPELSQPAQVVLSGALIMADWLASNESYFPLLPLDTAGNPALCADRAERAWERLSLPCAWEPRSYAMDAVGFEAVFGFPPNSVQAMILRAASEGNGGLFILEAQMGVGKTEAALAAAEILASQKGSGGIFFGLPTQATANGLFPRLVKWAEKQAEDTQQAIRLAHDMAELNEDYRALFHGLADGNEDAELEERLIVHPWFSGRKQALLANFVIGTVDQLLMAALKQKHVMLRHLGLAGKVVILDECHAYDAYMNQYLERTLNWLGIYKVPVIVLSATLPEQRRIKLVEAYLNGAPEKEDPAWRTQRSYPLLTWTEGREVRQIKAEPDGQERTVDVDNLASSEWIPCLSEATAAGGCCGVIVNTVREAIRLAQEAAEAIPEAEVLLLHSRFVAADRAKREALLLQRTGKNSSPSERAGLIVVGTQVLEQSLDIDFDLLITQLCPMDLLLQRLGRLHRHRRERPGSLSQARCYVLDLYKEADEGSRAVYGDWLLQRTRELLPERIILPQSIPQLVQDTYRNPEVTSFFPEQLAVWEKHRDEIKSKEMRANNYRIPAPKKSSRRSVTIDGWLNASYPADGVRGEAAVRDGEPSITVLLMQERADGSIGFLPWQEGGMEVSATHAPDEKTARKIARQRLTLPLSFSTFGREDRTIRELEELNRRKLPEWQHSAWLNGELILLLDEELRASLCGQSLLYSEHYGLICERG